MIKRWTIVILAFHLFVILGITSCSEGDQNPSFPTVTQTYLPTKTPLSTNSSTNTPAITPTPTLKWNPEVIEIVPSITCEGISLKRQVLTALWVSDNEFVYAYHNEPESVQLYNDAETFWISYKIDTDTEEITKPHINFDNSFWDRANIQKIAKNPELTGHFSPSGNNVIYNVWDGSVFDSDSRTEIWVAETKGNSRWKVNEFGYSKVYIYRAGWFDNETKVIFNVTYEGPTEFFISDILTGETTNLSDIAGFTIYSESTWRLSPDGETIALMNGDWRLLLISLATGETRVVEEFGGSFPYWSEDGTLLYYWWEKNGNIWDSVDELRVFNIHTGETHTVLDNPSFNWGFSNLEVNALCNEKDYYLPSNYAISPNGNNILLWGNYLYLLEIE